MIVRELLTRIGFQVDRKTEKQAGGAFENLKKAAGSLGIALSAGAVALGFKKMIDAASDVDETMNVVTTTFEDQTQRVLDWAAQSGEAAGRSQFAMREYAATLGAVVGPTLGSADATADLSTNMAQLAVDLGSFFNATDEEALEAIRAGLIGSTEPLLRFGVNMKVAALDAFALSEGLGKTTKDMSEAEVTMLRYRFILAKTTKAQGDAAKTADGFANQSKRLWGNVRDLAVGLGQELLPGAAGFLQTVNKLAAAIKGPLILGFRSLINAFNFIGMILRGLIEGLRGLGTAAQTTIATMAFVAAAFLAPWLLMPVLIAAAVAGAIAVLEDLWLGVSEGKGVLAGLAGEFQYQLEQTDSWASAMGEILTTAVDFWGELFTGFGNTTEDLGAWIKQIFADAGQGIIDIFAWIGSTISESIGITVDFIVGRIEWLAETIITPFNWIADGINNLLDKLNSLTGGSLTSVLSGLRSIFGGIGDIGKAAGFAGPSNITVPGSPAAAAAAARNIAANQTIEVNVNATGGDPRAIANAVAPAVGRAAGDQIRQVGQQLLAGGATP